MTDVENNVEVDIDGEGKGDEEIGSTEVAIEQREMENEAVQNIGETANEDINVEDTEATENRPTQSEEGTAAGNTEEVSMEGNDEGAQEGERRKKHKKHKKDKKDKKDKKHKKKKKRSASEGGTASLLDKEAQLDEEGEGKVSSDEEDDEGLNEYDTKDGFIADDLEEDILGGEGGQKKHKKRRKKNYNLDEDDFLLIEEAGGVQLHRPQREEEGDNRPFKRIKKKTDDTPAESTDLKLQLKNALFGAEAEEEEEEPSRPIPEEQDIDVDADEDDDIDAFIEHVDEFGQPIQKPKTHRKKRVGGISNARLREAEEIFGDIQEFLPRSMDEEEEAEKVKKPVKLEDAFDPDALKEHFMTPEDEEIRVTDIPERLQLRLPNRPPPDDNEIKDEAEWIYNRNFAGVQELPIHIVVPKIVHVLEFLRKDNFEIPFIYLYRKDHYTPDLALSDLWDIYDWDEKWAHLQSRKASLRQMYEKAQAPAEYYTTLDNCALESEVQDLMDHFKLYFGGEDMDPTQQTTKYKRAVKRDFYRICKKAGVIPFTKCFGLGASQFGENLMNNYTTNEPVDNEKAPEELALEYRCNEFTEAESVLRAARYVLAQEIAADPSVRQSVRVVYEEMAEISTFPTEKGRQLDVFHPYRPVVRIEKKPVSAFRAPPPFGVKPSHQEFHETEFLIILKALQEGFITLKVEIPQEYHVNELLKELEQLYLSEHHSLVAQAWNEQRKMILNDALTHHLYPHLEKELILKLTEETRAKVPLVGKVTEMLMAGPFRPPSDEYHETPEDIRVMACVYGSTRAPTMCAVLDPEGEVVSHLKLGYLTVKPTSKNDTRPDEDLETLKQFIIEHEPHVIALGAQLEARRLYDLLFQTVEDLHKARKTHKIHITYVGMDIAHIFGGSNRGKSEFPDFPPLLRQAVSIGRLLKDPLEEICGVCANPKELASLRLHPLQDMLGEEYLAKVVHRCCVNVVNKVGVDINRCVMHKYASSTLQFVSGLGPRKALGLINGIFKKGGKISSRDDLETYMGHCVYTNCAGVIRILEKYFKKNEDIDLLDNTRIHPDDYNLVKKIATDALEKDDDQDLIYELIHHPKKLDEIDFEAFADELERKGKPKKRSTLLDIKAEIHDPFSDPRKDLYKDPTPEELFTMLTGETDATLRQGMLVNAQIVAINAQSVRVKLDNGLVGFIRADYISDSEVKNIQSELSLEVGMPLYCRIREVHKDRFSVDLSCRSTDLARNQDSEMMRELTMWESYLLDEDLKQAGVVQKPKKKKPAILFRKIEHPFFQNVTAKEAEDALKDKDIGDVVIRPSSKGAKFLTITWKFFHDVYVHITVREEGKRNATTLGQILWIGEEKFEDLNEILARYVEPRTAFSQELFDFRNFRQGSQEEIEFQLRERKKAQPNTIPYFISVSLEHPGVFVLSYLPNNRIRKEFVNVTSDGLRFRKTLFTDPEKLVKWFKVHWKDPPPPSAPARSRDVAPEPMVDYTQGEMMDYDINTMNMGGYQSRPQQQQQQSWNVPQAQAAWNNNPVQQQPSSWSSGGWEQPPQQQSYPPRDHRQNQGGNNYRGGHSGGRPRDDRREPPSSDRGGNYGRGRDHHNSERPRHNNQGWNNQLPAAQAPPSNWENAATQGGSDWGDEQQQSSGWGDSSW